MGRRLLFLFLAVVGPALLLLLVRVGAGWTGASTGSGPVIISEVGWGGTGASGADEWIELHNNSSSAVSVVGWTLTDGGDLTVILNGAIAAGGYYLLERTDDFTIRDIPADQVYIGALSNAGEALILYDDLGAQVDSSNGDAGPWPAGTASPSYRSMERKSPFVADVDGNWSSNDGLTRNGLDADGNPINGTPAQPNSSWVHGLPGADLGVAKAGPSTAVAGTIITYQLAVDNFGPGLATGVVLTDLLPAGLSYLGDDSGFPLSNPAEGVFVWQVGTVSTNTVTSFHLNVAISDSVSGTITNVAIVSSPITDVNGSNNVSHKITLVDSSQSSQVLIDAVLYDGYELADADEAVRLVNVGSAPAQLDDWELTDGVSVARFPAGSVLTSGQYLWVSKQGSAFARQFGFLPDFEVTDSDPGVRDMVGTWPGFSNTGDEVILLRPGGFTADVLVYEAGDTSVPGWSGPSVEPYTVAGVFGSEGQILYRMRDQLTGRPVTDTDTVADWAQTEHDYINGRKVQYPGWDLDAFFFTHSVTNTATVTIAVAPDNAYTAIAKQIATAQSSLKVQVSNFEHVALAQAMVEAIQRGVTVTVLLEGGPAGGIDDQERLVCQIIETAGGQCWFMINDVNLTIRDRYRFLHAKYLIIDNQRVIISSENLTLASLPDDDKADGTWGRRGLLLITDAPGIVSRVKTLWSADFDPAAHLDLFRWSAGHPTYGAPPAGTVPITVSGGTTYSLRYSSPLTLQGTFAFELIQSPENSLRDEGGMLGMIARAGAGDTVLVEQLAERPYWGESDSNPSDDPNPRLEAYLAAARRGAVVRILLDNFFDDDTSPVSNHATCQQVNSIASAEGLDLACALSNPAGLGIHNKMVLVRSSGQGYIHLGSLNGTELSNKGNRELALQLKSNVAYDMLAELFSHDWPYRLWLPFLAHEYRSPADYLLISEVLYDPTGLDDAEFVEIVNPTGRTISLDGYSLGDALNRTDFEDVRHFPPGTYLGSHETLVVATTATGFRGRFGFDPDFEIVNSDPTVPDLIDDPTWGDPAAILQLGNNGDEVILRDAADRIVDAIGYGSGHVPGVISCPLVAASGRSLERFPYRIDTDDCTVDFRDWPLPNPNALP